MHLIWKCTAASQIKCTVTVIPCENADDQKNAQNRFLSFLLSTVTNRYVLFLFNLIEPNILRASPTSEFSHSLGQKLPEADLPHQ